MPQDTNELAPSSIGQIGFYVHQMRNEDDYSLNNRFFAWIRGDLDADALQQALDAVVERHPVLRTMLVPAAGPRPLRQEVLPAAPVVFERHDACAGTVAETEAEMRRIVQAFAHTPFDVGEEEFPFRALLVRVDDDRCLFGMMAHHIASDMLSGQILFRDVVAFYRSVTQGTDGPEPPAAQFADFATRQWDRLESGAMDRHADFWRETLAGRPPMVVPGARATAAASPVPQAGERLSRTLPDALATAVRGLAWRHRATITTVFLAALGVLCREKGVTQTTLCIPTANRPGPKFQDVVGCFMNPVLVVLEAQPGEPFAAVLDRMRDRASQAYAHREYPVDRLKALLDDDFRDIGYPPGLLFQLLQRPDELVLEAGGCVFERILTDMHRIAGLYFPQARLQVLVWEERDRITCSFDYDAAAFERETVQAMLDRYVAILHENAGAAPA
ncbi:MAG: hypothetical protein KDC18_14275 [Alphaproteobacteria bacterium]|nr:hypothetical protein [Alphaproteobacteria bacterium]MCB9928623.1 hypothetical protein [Alphaproteobacteria bacterium]